MENINYNEYTTSQFIEVLRTIDVNKINRDRLYYSLMFFAEKYNEGNSYALLFKSNNISYPERVRLIVYLMFINEFDPCSSSNVEFIAYKTILKYANELQLNGFVDFE